MNPLLPISLRMLLWVSSALALAALAAATPTSAQSLYRCVGRDGQVVISKSAPDAPVPAACQEAAAQKDLEAVKQYLNQRIVDLASLQARCRAAQETNTIEKEDALDAIDSLADNRATGRVSRRERRTAKEIEESAKRVDVKIAECLRTTQTGIAEAKAVLSTPERLRAELPKWLAASKRDQQLAEARRDEEIRREKWLNANILRAEQEMQAAAAANEARERDAARRVSDGLRDQWLALLDNTRGAYDILAPGASYEDFYLRLKVTREQSQFIRTRFARQLQMGDHQTLGMAVSAAAAALSAAETDFRMERWAADSLATAKMNAAKYSDGTNLSNLDRANAADAMRRLREAQQHYDNAKTQLLSRRDSLTPLMSEATRVAKEELAEARQVSKQAPLDGRLVSLDFKDADVVYLLRILSAESGRNIVVSEDVKGRMSVSLHNVSWEQALARIIEARGLQRLDRNGTIHISTAN
jgi:hypothetical protein